ncbi:Vasodilator-stimulated phosphoprotein [Acipenser ruthenus]|uniref:Vasodilator-stimulated phosphoprotein n=1 Tax=Acipenser ruthenus TaxID=7906 RepID=A0A444U9J5_ACIRT|nr:Vasodilator-stimulated phosphoprotein [Acipenser ruthenus]
MLPGSGREGVSAAWLREGGGECCLALVVRETSICQARATVMIYDDSSKKWLPAGTGPQVLSRVQIYHSPAGNSFRVVGRKMQPDQQVRLRYTNQYRETSIDLPQPRWELLQSGGAQDAVRPAGTLPSPRIQNGPTPEELEQQRRQQLLEQQQRQEQLEREQREQLERERRGSSAGERREREEGLQSRCEETEGEEGLQSRESSWREEGLQCRRPVLSDQPV